MEQPPLLRPLGTADLLDTALRLYRRNFGPFLGITAVVYVPVAVLQIVAAFFMGRMMTAEGELDTAQLASLIPFAVLMGGAMIIYMIALPLSQGALSIAVARRYLGQPTSVADAYQTIGHRWGGLLAAVFLAGLMVLMGTVLCIIPGFYLAIGLMFVPAVVVLEGHGVVDSLRRSWDLVKGDWWRCFGVYFLLSMIIQVVAGAVVWPVTAASTLLLMERNPALMQAINQGIGMVVSIFAQPVQIIGLVLLYYDQRVRREGFDLELLAHSLGTEVPKTAGSGGLVAGYPPPPPIPGPALTPSGVPLPPRLDEPPPPPAASGPDTTTEPGASSPP